MTVSKRVSDDKLQELIDAHEQGYDTGINDGRRQHQLNLELQAIRARPLPVARSVVTVSERVSDEDLKRLPQRLAEWRDVSRSREENVAFTLLDVWEEDILAMCAEIQAFRARPLPVGLEGLGEALETGALQLEVTRRPEAIAQAALLRTHLADLAAGVREKCPFCSYGSVAPLGERRPCPTCHGTGGPVSVLPLAVAKEEKADG